jgi:Bifunctional DNA primase/polymerase, N-terminal/Primase C terminal 2 (PriCT-2)
MSQRVFRIWRRASPEWVALFEAGNVVELNRLDPPSSRVLRIAARHAIAAFAKSGRMLDAALMYARFGLPIMPVDQRTKRPIPRRDRDPTGKYKDGIPGTGGVYKATCDLIIVQAWWKKHPRALIALALGERSGVWVLDVDTSEEHTEGFTAWNALKAEHEAFETREHLTATDGSHLWFAWDGEQPVGCSSGALPKGGIEVKGQGGYVVLPPSVRKGRRYRVGTDIDPILAPPWLMDLISQGRPPPRQGGSEGAQQFDGKAQADKDELTEIMSFIPSDESVDTVEWFNTGLRMFAASGGSDWGFQLFDEWSRRWSGYFHQQKKIWVGYNAAETRARWEAMKGSPPNRTGVDKLRQIAREHGWVEGLRAHAPRYEDEGKPISDAERAEIRRMVPDFLASLLEPKKHRNVAHDYAMWVQWFLRQPDFLPKYTSKKLLEATPWWYQNMYAERDVEVDGGLPTRRFVRKEEFDPQEYELPPLVWALKVVTGGGKTSILIEEIANFMRDHGPKLGPLIYAVPQHKLGRKVIEQFEKHGVNARIFRGYLAADLDHPENIALLEQKPDMNEDELPHRMCKRPFAVELALRQFVEVASACCKCKGSRCPFFDPGPEQCAYQGQKGGKDDAPDVWIVASDMVFHTQPVFKKATAIIIDESFWQKGLRGTDSKGNWSVPLASLSKPPRDTVPDDEILRNFSRVRLAEALSQKNMGGVERKHLIDELYDGVHECRVGIAREWEWLSKHKLEQKPGMSDHVLNRLAENYKELIDKIGLARRIITIWEEIRNVMLHDPEIEVSGRLTLENNKDGLRVISWRGVEAIRRMYRKPTLLVDAVLPDERILEVFHPQVELIGEINAGTDPRFVNIQQIIGAPTSKQKLKLEKNRQAVKRYILEEWQKNGRGDCLVICQKDYHEWLLQQGLPKSIYVEHYNRIHGDDTYKFFTLQIQIGRTRPRVQHVEAMAGALFGKQPVLVPLDAFGHSDFETVSHGIRLRNGSGIRTRGVRHPDPLVEVVRWQIEEGELVNAEGRARAINRGAATPPVKIRRLFDTCIPITADEVQWWQAPSMLVEAVWRGLVSSSPKDLVTLWPQLFANIKAAQRALKDGLPQLPGLLPIHYQLAGERQKPRLAIYDPLLIPNALAWLQDRLGPMVWPGDGPAVG